jgi:hypothetical protein
MTINQRAPVHNVLVDVTCTGRMYDFMLKLEGRWLIRRRQPIYEKSRIDPVDPSATLQLDPKLLASFPEGYCHLAYLQSQNGFQCEEGIAGLKATPLRKFMPKEKPGLRVPKNLETQTGPEFRSISGTRINRRMSPSS